MFSNAAFLRLGLLHCWHSSHNGYASCNNVVKALPGRFFTTMQHRKATLSFAASLHCTIALCIPLKAVSKLTFGSMTEWLCQVILKKHHPSFFLPSFHTCPSSYTVAQCSVQHIDRRSPYLRGQQAGSAVPTSTEGSLQ